MSDPASAWPPPEPAGPRPQTGPGDPSTWYYPPGTRPGGGTGPPDGGPSPARRQPVLNGRRTIWIAVIAGAVILLSRSHRITRDEIILFCVIVPSIILHEVAHGWVALACGDDTAKRAGRLTLNPLAHIDLIGTIILPIILILSGFGWFGYAKPVPVNVGRLRSPRNQGVLVSLAGPATNVVLAAAAAVVFHLSNGANNFNLWAQILFYLGLVNVWLAAFNMLPIPPLDGSILIERALPAKWWPGYLNLRRYAFPLLLAAVILGSYVDVGGQSVLSHFSNETVNWWIRLLGGH
ncbi:MAG TPA: site-2 protease family protein [Acidimicrobiales bacterium]|nr:site-2 protease family protein [Acidimicrobiales bacterium]